MPWLRLNSPPLGNACSCCLSGGLSPPLRCVPVIAIGVKCMSTPTFLTAFSDGHHSLFHPMFHWCQPPWMGTIMRCCWWHMCIEIHSCPPFTHHATAMARGVPRAPRKTMCMAPGHLDSQILFPERAKVQKHIKLHSCRKPAIALLNWRYG